MSQRWPDRWLDALMLGFVMWPLRLTESRSRVVRMAGLLLHVFWCVPAMIVAIIPFTILFIAMMVVDTWHGEA